MPLRAPLALLLLVLAATPAPAVQQIFDPAGASFYDVPFPMELRRDGDGSVSLAGFPFPPGNALVQSYRVALERTRGFGLASGVFLKFDGAIDLATLPADPAASAAQMGKSGWLPNRTAKFTNQMMVAHQSRLQPQTCLGSAWLVRLTDRK